MLFSRLILEDGTTFTGNTFGFEGSVAGEVVFNTAMTGYPESLTDPSYCGQILVLTYPLIGNYGVPPFDCDNSIFRFFESEKIHIKALVISDYSFENSHWNAKASLSDWLKNNKIPGLFNIDTRKLTKIIREKGAMTGKIVYHNEDIALSDPNTENIVKSVSTKTVKTYGNGLYKIILVDCGVKNNIIRRLLCRDTHIIRVPWDYDFSSLDYDALFISNGPGDPKKCESTITHLKKAFLSDKPVFGICLGNQLMALASGADTYKLKYGHRSHNQPVLQKGTNRCYITSQNHGFATDTTTLQSDWEEIFININDGTNEGIRHKYKPFFSVQFHPEASSGPTDTDFLFDDFIEMIKKCKSKYA